MAKVAVTETYLTDIADAIRQKTGSVDTYKPSEMAGAILDIPSGGGSSPWTHIKHAEYAVSTTSTSFDDVATLRCGADIWTYSKIVYVRIRDTAGARDGHFVGTDTFYVNVYPASGGASSTSSSACFSTKCKNGMKFATVMSTYGVYPYTMYSDGRILIKSRYSASGSLTVDGTYSVDVFTLDYPEGYPSPFVV